MRSTKDFGLRCVYDRRSQEGILRGQKRGTSKEMERRKRVENFYEVRSQEIRFSKTLEIQYNVIGKWFCAGGKNG